jgi:hypothetical protein
LRDAKREGLRRTIGLPGLHVVEQCSALARRGNDFDAPRTSGPIAGERFMVNGPIGHKRTAHFDERSLSM